MREKKIRILRNGCINFYLFSFNNACSQYYYSGGMGVYGIH